MGKNKSDEVAAGVANNLVGLLAAERDQPAKKGRACHSIPMNRNNVGRSVRCAPSLVACETKERPTVIAAVSGLPALPWRVGSWSKNAGAKAKRIVPFSQ